VRWRFQSVVIFHYYVVHDYDDSPGYNHVFYDNNQRHIHHNHNHNLNKKFNYDNNFAIHYDYDSEHDHDHKPPVNLDEQ
jgi:hypothetical protein